MEYKCHITHSDINEGVSKRTGNNYSMVQIQGILEVGNDRQIFRTTLPRGIPKPEKGLYTVTFLPVADYRSMELTGQIVSLKPATPQAK